jgi:hypothetical protein
VVVRETGSGKLSPVGQPDALADAICHVIQNRDRYSPTTERVRQIFNTEKSLDQYQTILENLLTSSQSAMITVNRAGSAEKGRRLGSWLNRLR